jgi:hypothetical protein
MFLEEKKYKRGEFNVILNNYFSSLLYINIYTVYIRYLTGDDIKFYEEPLPI